MRIVLAVIGGALALVVACNGGAGAPNNLRGGPDGIPSSSIDEPGGGYAPPGSSNQDSPGSSGDLQVNQSATTSCLVCVGTYACTIFSNGQTTIVTVSMTKVADGCQVGLGGSDAATSTILLGCVGDLTGKMFSTDTDGQSVNGGTWTGDDNEFVMHVAFFGPVHEAVYDATCVPYGATLISVPDAG
jgi:hypothetical protein